MNLEYDRLVTNHWGSIRLSVYTLMMFATVDSAGAIYIPMSQHRPVLILVERFDIEPYSDYSAK